jgi:hypothetical protein
MVACQLHKQTYFYPYNEADKDEKKDVVINDGATQSQDATTRTPPPTQPDDLLKLSCMNRDLSYMDNSCIKWMFKLYHMVKKGQGWQQCSSFDYSRHSTSKYSNMLLNPRSISHFLKQLLLIILTSICILTHHDSDDDNQNCFGVKKAT